MAITNVYFAPNLNIGNAYGTITIATANQIQITSGERVQNYFGNNFTYDGESVIGGTVTQTNYYENGKKVYEVSEGNYSAVTIANLVLSGDTAGLMTYIYSGSDHYNGCSENDIIKTGAEDDQIYGNGGNDSLNGGTGNDTLDGGANTDIAIFSSAKANAAITKTASGWEVSSTADSTDTLTDVERLQFSDKKVALDIDDNALETLQFIGVIAPSLQGNLNIRGTILSLFDQGKSMQEMAQLALDLGLITSDNTALAKTVFKNVFNTTADPDQSLTNSLVGFIEQNGDANFLATVAGLNINVDLVGLQQHGMEFI